MISRKSLLKLCIGVTLFTTSVAFIQDLFKKDIIIYLDCDMSVQDAKCHPYGSDNILSYRLKKMGTEDVPTVVSTCHTKLIESRCANK